MGYQEKSKHGVFTIDSGKGLVSFIWVQETWGVLDLNRTLQLSLFGGLVWIKVIWLSTKLIRSELWIIPFM